MSFQSFHFIVLLVAVVLGANIVVKRNTPRKVFLLAASYYFYLLWDWRFAGLLALITLVNYVCGRGIFNAQTEQNRRFWLSLALTISLLNLVCFKYLGFFVDSFYELFGLFGAKGKSPIIELALPLGISFYTFQSLSYPLDIFRRQIEPTHSLLDFALYISFFPQLTAGPIIRPHQFLPQLEKLQNPSDRMMQQGLALVVRGFIKKIAFADTLGMHLVNPAFSDYGNQDFLFLLVGIYGYSFQIYMDFSGYTDIARGCGKLLGYEIPINFRRPYQALSISEFWQRWHITMSSYFRDYIFYSMRGRNLYLSVMLTFVTIGFWHGAGWNFILYGLIHGAIVGFEVYNRQRRRRLRKPELVYLGLRKALRIFWIFQIVAFARVLFRAGSVEASWEYIGAMLTNFNFNTQPLPLAFVGLLLVAVVLHYVPYSFTQRTANLFYRLPAFAQAGALVVIIMGFVVVQPTEAPFIYFQF